MTIQKTLRNLTSGTTPAAAMAAGLLLAGTALAGPTTDGSRPAHETIDIDQRPCQADMDGDGFVGFAELNMLITQWGTCADRADEAPGTGASEVAADPCTADVNGDGHVGFIDLNIMLNQWGLCGVVTLP